MQKKIYKSTFFILFSSFSVFAQIPSGYYNAANGKTGAELKTALWGIIKNPSVTSYGGLYTSFQTTDVKANGKVWDMYSDIPGGTPPYEYSYGSGTCGNYSKEGDCYNREHSFPQSWFNSSSPMVSDLFHLYPTDGKVNRVRSNFPYGEVGTATNITQNGSKLGNSKSTGYTSTVFEPIDEYKGDLARGILYMVTCYEDRVVSWQGNGNANEILAGNTFPAFDKWQLDLLAKWHIQDPVSAKEINRNNRAYQIQGNRNPFIDHPEYAGLIWGFSTISGTNICNGITPNVQLSTISVTGILANSASISWANGNGIARIIKINTNNTFTNLADGSNYNANASFSNTGEQVVYNASGNAFIVTGLNTLTTYYLKGYEYNCSTLTGNLYANATASSNPFSFTTASVTGILTASTSGVALLNQSFSPCPATGWQNIQVTGSKNWVCNAGGFMEANGYISSSSTPAQESWLVSPAFNSTSTTGLTVSFRSATRYTDNALPNPQISVFYSTNFSGSGAPASANWTSIAGFAFPSTNSDVIDANIAWLNSGIVTVNGISSNAVYLAFRYKSSGSGASSSTRWRVDNVEVNGLSTVSGVVTVPVNHAPVVSDITLTGFNTDTLKGSLAGQYYDVDEETIFLTTELNEETAQHGFITIFDDGTVNYVPLQTFTGIDSFLYSVCDQATCTSGMIYFNVLKNNHAPLASSFTISGIQNTTFTGSLTGRFSDQDNNVLTITAIDLQSTTQGGKISINASGAIAFVPALDFTGFDAYQYQVCNPSTCSSAMVYFKVKYGAPIAKSATYTIPRNLAFTGSIASLIADPKNSQVSLQSSLITSVGGATFQLKSNGDFTYIPKTGFAGVDSYIYKVCNIDTCSYGTLNFSIAGVVTGIPSFSETISIYPQPAAYELNIESNKALIRSIKILDILGEEVWIIKGTDAQSITIDISKFNLGSYFMLLETDDTVISKRILVLK